MKAKAKAKSRARAKDPDEVLRVRASSSCRMAAEDAGLPRPVFMGQGAVISIPRHVLEKFKEKFPTTDFEELD